MPENKRLLNTGLQEGDQFILEGTLSFARTKRPYPNKFDQRNWEFSVTLTQTPENQIQIQIPQNVDPTSQQRIQQGAQIYLQNALKPSKTKPNESNIYFVKRARFDGAFDPKDQASVMAALNQASTIYTLKQEADGSYARYEGNDPAQDTNPRVKVVVNIYAYNNELSGQSGITDGIQYVMYPADMVAFSGGGSNSAQATLEHFGERYSESATPTDTATPTEQAPAFNPAGFAPTDSAPATPTSNPFAGQPSQNPFATPAENPFANANQPTQNPFAAPTENPFG